MKVLLTGATGFTGAAVLTALRERAVLVRCYARSPEKARALSERGIEVVLGNLGDLPALTKAAEGCDILLNVASIGFGHAPGIVQAAECAGIRRAVFISTTAIFTQLNAPSKSARLAAENAVRASRLQWTILRPTMIYGTSGDRNIARLIRFVARYPILPVFGTGNYLMQPIYVHDLAEAIVSAAMCSAAENREYNVSGREPLTYNQLVATVIRLMGRRVRLLHLPHHGAIKVLQALENVGLQLPIKAEQIQRLNEHKAFSWEHAGADFGFSPRSFAQGVEEEIRSMGYALATHA